MNRDDILKMEAGREMDALVAEKVMGQTDFSHPGFFWSEGTTEDGEDGWDGFLCPRCNTGGILEEKHLNDPPKCTKFYSTDIAAAWEVAEKMDGLGYDFYVEKRPNKTDWFAMFDKDVTLAYANTAPTAPLAICRSALLAVMEAEA